MKFFLLPLVAFLFTKSYSQTYTFNGNGNWSIANNWLNSTIPPSTLPAGSTIYISPANNDSCVLNVIQIFLPGSNLIISSNANFIVHSVSNITVTAICNQIWMKKNLDIVTYKNGDTIPQFTNLSGWNSLKNGAWCYPNNDSALGLIYGKLYNWYAVNDPRGLAPKGWHIPTGTEWLTLSNCLGGLNISGGKMKDTGTAYWRDPNNGATNSSGFTGLPGGSVSSDFGYWGKRFFGDWSSSSETINNEVCNGLLYADSVSFTVEYAYNTNYNSRGWFNSVRCVLGDIPVLSTSSSTLTSSTLISGGNILSDGGSAIISRGVVWSKIDNPTIVQPTRTANGSGNGIFVSNIMGLDANVRYHVRAYATNNSGTAYGDDYAFTTPVPENFPTDTLICGKRWATRNLTASSYRNGDLIPEVTDRATWASLTSGAWCWYNNDSATYASMYGKLYNWYAVNDPRGLAPEGWHIPSDSDWVNMENCLGTGNTAAHKLKEAGTNHWISNNEATNSSGFTGLPGGITTSNGSFSELGDNGHWWSSKDAGSGFAYLYVLRSNPSLSTTLAQLLSTTKDRGLSVRCIRN
jgi:uncharacterized protein (TIGR02145 family)